MRLQISANPPNLLYSWLTATSIGVCSVWSSLRHWRSLIEKLHSVRNHVLGTVVADAGHTRSKSRKLGNSFYKSSFVDSADFSSWDFLPDMISG